MPLQKIENKEQALTWFQKREDIHFWIKFLNPENVESDGKVSIGYHGMDANTLERTAFKTDVPFTLAGCDDELLLRMLQKGILYPFAVEVIVPHLEDETQW